MPNYIPKEIGLDHNVLGPGIEILYSTWTITRVEDQEIVHYTERDDVNKLSKLFTDVFELGKKYSIKMSMVRTDGPTVDTDPYILLVTDNKDIIDLYPIPSVIDMPIVTVPYDKNNIPSINTVFNTSEIKVAGNAVHSYSDWWLTDDSNKVVFKSLRDSVNLTSIKLKNIVLDSETVYTMHCIHYGTNRDASGAGSYTFRPKVVLELDIVGDLKDSFFTLPINTSLLDIPSNIVKLEIELYGEDQVLLYKTENTTGLIDIPREKINGDYMLLEDDGYEYYTMRLRMTTSNNVYGWREYIFRPKKWIVESAVFDDSDFVYKDKISLAKVKIDGFKYATGYTGMIGGVSQLPDGLFLIMYEFKKWGLFEYINYENRFKKIKEVDMSFLYTGPIDDYPSFDAMILPDGVIHLATSYIHSTTPKTIKSHLFRYNAITKKITYDKEILSLSSAEEIIVAAGAVTSRYMSKSKIIEMDKSNTRAIGYHNLLTNIITIVDNNMPNSADLTIYSIAKLSDNVFRYIGISKSGNTVVESIYFDITFNTDGSVSYSPVLPYVRNIPSNNTTNKRAIVTQLRNGDMIMSKRDILNKTTDIAVYDKDDMSIKKYNVLTLDSTYTDYGFTIHFNNGKRMIMASGDGLADSIIYE